MSSLQIHISVDRGVISGIFIRHEVFSGGPRDPVFLILKCASHDLFDSSVMYVYARSDTHIPVSRKSPFK